MVLLLAAFVAFHYIRKCNRHGRERGTTYNAKGSPPVKDAGTKSTSGAWPPKDWADEKGAGGLVRGESQDLEGFTASGIGAFKSLMSQQPSSLPMAASAQPVPMRSQEWGRADTVDLKGFVSIKGTSSLLTPSTYPAFGEALAVGGTRGSMDEKDGRGSSRKSSLEKERSHLQSQPKRGFSSSMEGPRRSRTISFGGWRDDDNTALPQKGIRGPTQQLPTLGSIAEGNDSGGGGVKWYQGIPDGASLASGEISPSALNPKEGTEGFDTPSSSPVDLRVWGLGPAGQIPSGFAEGQGSPSKGRLQALMRSTTTPSIQSHPSAPGAASLQAMKEELERLQAKMRAAKEAAARPMELSMGTVQRSSLRDWSTEHKLPATQPTSTALEELAVAGLRPPSVHCGDGEPIADDDELVALQKSLMGLMSRPTA